MSLTGGEVAEGRAASLTVQINAAEVVAGLIIQTCGIDDSAGGHHPDNIPLHQPLGGGGVLHLLADGHLVALDNQPGDVGLAGVIGEKQNGIRIVLLDFQILLHHGGQFRHKNTSFFIFQQMFLFYDTRSYKGVPPCGTGKHGDTMQN